MLDQVSVIIIPLMSVCSRSYINMSKVRSVLDQTLVLRIMLMSFCSRSDVNISKSDLNVRSDIIVTVR